MELSTHKEKNARKSEYTGRLQQCQYPGCSIVLQFYKTLSLQGTGYQVKGTEDLSVLLITISWESTIISIKNKIPLNIDAHSHRRIPTSKKDQINIK